MKKLIPIFLVALLSLTPLALADEKKSCGYSEKRCTGDHCYTWECKDGWLMPVDIEKDISYIAHPCPVCGGSKTAKGVRNLSGSTEASKFMRDHLRMRKSVQKKATGAK